MGSSAETGIPHLETEHLFGDQKRRVRNSLIPIGLISFREGNFQLVQKLMRARVVAHISTYASLAA
ncbi:hypothetical protein AMTRI_Chr09g14600 [Amborella trichopoda]